MFSKCRGNSVNMLDSIENICTWIITIGLLIVFSYWTSGALNKYLDQPISTQIKFRVGEDNFGHLSHPAFTVCDANISTIISKLGCGQNESNLWTPFHKILLDCMSLKNQKLTLQEMLSKVEYSRGDLISVTIEPNVLIGLQALQLQDQFWKPFIHKLYGPCYTFDASRVPEYKSINVSNSAGLYLSLSPKALLSSTLKIMLHDSYDLPDAETLYPVLYPETSGHHIYVDISKKVIQLVSTKKEPCNQYPPRTCSDRLVYKQIYEKYKCELFLLKHGNHLDDLRQEKAPICNNSITLSYLSELQHGFKGVLKECHNRQACNQTKYLLMKLAKNNKIGDTVIKVQYLDPIVEYNIDSINYDLQSMIGEVGGTLGLTLGLSGLSLVQMVFYLIRKLPII